MPETYTITEYTYGVTLSKRVPIYVLIGLINMYKKDFNYDILYGDIAQYLNVGFALGSKYHYEDWKKEIGMK